MYTVPFRLPTQLRSLLKQDVTPSTTPDAAPESTNENSSATSDFAGLMRSLLKGDAAKNVNEEELFSALVVERVRDLKGEEGAKEFQAILDKHRAANTGRGSYVFEEKAAREALQEYQSSGKITLDEADTIHSEAFGAAQLDDNTTALFDSVGGANDPTRAVASIESAIEKAKGIIEKYKNGELTRPTHRVNDDYSALGISTVSRTLSGVSTSHHSDSEAGEVTPVGNKIDGTNGLLWKPVSHTLNRAIVMLHPSHAQKVRSVVLKDSEGKVIDRARYFSGGSEEYPREKWVFRRRGEDYPANATLVIKFKNGRSKTVALKHPDQRYD